MSCFHPLVGLWKGEVNENGKKVFKIEGNLDPIIAKQLYPGSVTIPCGKCYGCRLDYSRRWADRMMLELETAKSGIFLTLTYDNDHITFCHCNELGEPDFGTLVKRDVQLFMKRLRKKFSDRTIRFFCCGEYGDRTLRPHYHLILFGIGINDLGCLRSVGFNELRQEIYTSDIISNLWSNGFISVADVSWRTCAYVARYVVKKSIGDHGAINEYLNQLPEFTLMSRRPGLGSQYYDDHPDCLDYQTIYLSSSDGSLKVSIPKYYLNKLKLTDPNRYDNIIEDRKTFANDNMLAKLANTDLSYLELLEVEENEKLRRTSSLRRYI